MKFLIITGLLLMSMLVSQAQTAIKDDGGKVMFSFDFYESDTIMTRIKDIVRTDSIKNDNTGYQIYKSYDSNDVIVQELKYYNWQSNTDSSYLTKNTYDKNGKILLYEHLSMLGAALERYKYTYNNKGLLVKKEGFGSGQLGISIVYTYSESGELISTKAYRSGKEVKNYFQNIK